MYVLFHATLLVLQMVLHLVGLRKKRMICILLVYLCHLMVSFHISII